MSLPGIPETFEWIEASWGAALRCRPLGDVAPHLFTTRQLPLSSEGDWKAIAAAVGASDLQMLTQVHGKAVFVAQGFSPAKPKADVVVSDDPEIAIAVRAADCVPILIADPSTGAVAAAHAGWRGTCAGAGRAAVEALAREFRARPADLIAAIGPSIGPCCYDVGSTVVDAFAAARHARDLVDRWFLTRSHRELKLDLWAANRDQLILAGLDERNIHVSGLCTASHTDLFPSYRVEGSKAGRIVGVIRSNQPRNAQTTRS